MEHVGAAVLPGPEHGAGDHVASFERARVGMWFFLASEIMMFGAFIAVYVVLWMANPGGPGQAFDKAQLSWPIACFNTAVLIVSSYTMVRAVHAISRDDKGHCKTMLYVTAALGALFLVVKGYEYSLKFSHGIGPSTNVFYGCYFLMTGFHGFHVLVGVILLAVYPSFVKHFSSVRYAHIENIALYWHFVDLVWIFLFPIVYLL
jgi:heme/copper-type cytochrome/quinol oxidase subunit 3